MVLTRKNNISLYHRREKRKEKRLFIFLLLNCGRYDMATQSSHSSHFDIEVSLENTNSAFDIKIVGGSWITMRSLPGQGSRRCARHVFWCLKDLLDLFRSSPLANSVKLAPWRERKASTRVLVLYS